MYYYSYDSCDYFLIEDVVRCETENPEYIGNVTPESLGLAQGESPKEPKGNPEYIPVDDLQKAANLSPSKFVELLRTHREDLPFYGFFSESDRYFFYGENVEPVRAVDRLSGIAIHHLDWKKFIRKMEEGVREGGEPNDDGSLPKDVSDPEHQLAEAQTQNESLR
jgi:hypothetical protein